MFFTQTEAVLFLFALRLCSVGPLAQGFTRGEFTKALRALGCNLSAGSIYRVFRDVCEHDNHPLFSKIDPGGGSGSRYCKFRLRSLEDIRRRLTAWYQLPRLRRQVPPTSQDIDRIRSFC